MRIHPLISSMLSPARAIAILSLLLLGFSNTGFSQTSTEFWFAPPELSISHGGNGNIYIRLAAGAAGADVNIDMPANPGALNGGSPINVVLAANESQTVNLTSFINILETRPLDNILNTGIHITSTEEITAIYEPGPNNNVDLFSLKGQNGLGTEFYVPMQNLWRNQPLSTVAYTSFDIVATEDNTTILIYPTQDLEGGHDAYESYTITLNEGQTYSGGHTVSLSPELNPSGSIILADKPIAVSVKDDSIRPTGQGCYDLIGDQIVPVDIVGNEYIVNKGGLSAATREYIYVVATENNTTISIDGVQEAILFNAETYVYEITNDLTYVSGDKDFYLIHVSGFGCESGMAQLPSLNCAGSEQVSFTRSTSESFFINLLVSAGHEDAFVLNGDPNIIDPTDFDPVPGTGGAWMGAQIQFSTGEIAAGSNNLITNTEEVFSMGLINGGASSGCRFGYFSQFSAEIIVDAGPDQTVCANRDTELAGDVTGGATQGVWTTNGTGTFNPDANTFNAIYEPSLADLSAGTVTLTLTSVSNCFPVEDEVVITYTPAPVVVAGTDIAACENNTVVTLDGFIDIATGGIWSGGGGTFDPTSGTLDAEYTPTAAEVTAGSVTLTLTSTGNGTCFAETDEVEITFGPAPTADAGLDQTLCANDPDAQLNGAITLAGGGEWLGGNGLFTPSNQSLTPVYTPSPGELLNGFVTLTLSTTDNGGCLPVTDDVTLTFTDAPTVDAGSDQSLCRNNADITLNGGVTIATGGTWSGGTGTFNPDANTLNAVYTPSLPELLAGTVTLTLTSTGNGDCIAETDDVTFTFTDAPIVNAGADGVVCENNADISLNGSLIGANFGIWSGGGGTFTPSTTALNAVYTPTAAEITSGSVTLTLTSLDNGTCNQVTDDVTYTFSPAPTANAGVDQSVCENNADITLAGSVTIASGGQWTGGAGTFTPDANTLNAIYTPTAGELFAGSVTLTLTTTGNGTCSPVTDDVTVTFTDAPTANAGTDQTLCANNADITLNGSVTIATGGTWSGGLGLFTPDANTLNAVYTPTASEIASGSLTLTLTTTGNADCSPVTDEVDFTFTPAPVVEAGTPISVCSNNAQVSLNGSVTVAGGGTWSGGAGTFVPNANALNALYNPTPAEIAAGSLILTLTSTSNGNCSAELDVVTITFTPEPTANAGTDQTVCANDPTVNLLGNVSLATGGQWSGGSGTFTPNNTSLGAAYTPSAAEIAAGSVTLTLTTTGNGTCLAVDDQMTITITPAPVVEAGAGGVLCANNSDITLNGSVTVASGGIWSGGSGTFTPDASTLNAVYSPSATEIANGSVTLTLTSTGNGDCIAETDDVTYTFSPAPTADAGTDIVVCENNADATLNGSVTIAGGGVWSGGAGVFTPNANALNAVYTPTAAEITAGSVTLTLTTTGNGTCNPVTDDVEISFTDAPTANAGVDQTVCANDPDVNLNGSVTIASGGVWSGGAGTFAPNNSTLGAVYTPSAAEIAAGTVTLTLTTTGNGDCNSVTDQIEITITPAPTADAGTGFEVCGNNPDITLGGAVTVATGGTWTGGGGTFTPDANTLNAVYTPTLGEIASGTLTLTLTTTGNGDCIAVSDDVTYTFGDSPTVDAGADQVLCENNADITLAGAVTIATGGVWSGGTGTFTPNANTLNAVYTPSAAELTAGSVTLTLTTTGNGNCLAETDDMTVTFTPAPTADAGTDQTVCANNPDVNLSGSVSIATGGTWSGGFGTFSPDANSLFATYTPSLGEIAAGTVTLTLTTTGNGNCTPVTDEIEITITPAPTADAGADATFCANNADITLGGAVTVATGGTWTGGAGSFTPDANTLNAVYTPTAGEITAGTVTLTLTTTGNGDCIGVSDDVTYTFTPAPTVDAGVDQTLCENNADVTLAGAVTIAGGGTWSGGAGTFAPNANTLNAVYTPTAAELTAGSVTLTLTTTGNGTCVAETDDVTITFTDAPTADAGVDQTVCANDPDVNLSGSVTIATGGTWSGGFGTFSPNANSLFATYTPSLGEIAAGTVTLTLTTTGNGNCTAVTDQIEITITPSPTADAGTDATFCANNADITLGGAVTVATGGTWTGGAGTFNPDANTLNAVYTPTAGEIAAGTVTLTLTTTGNGDCIAVTDDVTYTFTPAPTVDAGPDQAICENNADVTLAGAVTIAGGATWSGGAGTFAPNANTLNAVYTPTAAELTAGSVTLTLTTTGNGTCIAETDDMTITFTDAPTADAGVDQTVCGNNPDVNLSGSVTIATGGTWSGGFGTFSPNANSLFATYTPSLGEIAAGTVTLTLTTTGNGNCTAVTDEIEITITPAPTADAGTGGVLCENNADITLNGSVTVATGGTWSGGNGTFTPDVNTLNAVYTPSVGELTAGTVTLTLTTTGNGDCLAVTDDVTYTFSPAPTVDAGVDQTLCENNPVATLSGAITVAGGATWSGGAGTFSPNANALNATYTPTAAELTAGTVTLTLTTTSNGTCNPESDDIVLTFTPAPTATAGADQSVCANNPDVNLTGSVTNATGGTWSGGFGTFSPNANSLFATYTPSAGEIAAGTVTLTLTTTGIGNCLAVTDEIEITITPDPTVNAGADDTFCGNNADIALNGSVTIATGGQWSGGAGTFNPDANTLNAVYTPSASEIASGSITLTLTSTGNGNCAVVTDEVTYTFTPAPTADAGTDITVCSNNADVSLAGAVTIASGGVWSGGAGTFNPSANALNATYTPTAAEIAAGTLTLTLTTTGNGDCNAESDDVEITFSPSPTANAGTDDTVCANNPDVNLNGQVTVATGGTWSGGGGTFAPNNNTLGAVYTPSAAEIAAGTVTLTLTTTGNGDCNAVSDDVEITITPAPVVNAGADADYCANNADITLNGSVSVATGGTWSGGSGIFTPDANTLNAVYTPSAGEIALGSITLTLTSTGNGDCVAETDEVTFTFSPAPTVDAGADQDVCTNNADVSLAGAVTIASGGVWSGGAGTFSPSANALNATYTPTAAEIAAGTLTLTLTTTGNGTCNAESDDMEITFTPSPTANAGADESVCANDPDVVLGGSVTIATGGVWSGGAGTFTPNNTTLGAVYTPSVAEIAAGTVTLTLTTTGNGNCNPVTDDVVITITPAPVVEAGVGFELCANAPDITLGGSVTVATGGTWTGGGGTFTPDANTLNAVYTPTLGEIASGTITLTLTSTGNGTCLAVSDDVTYTFGPAPTVDAGVDQTLCDNNADVSLGGSVTVATGGVWSGGAGTFSPNANTLNAVYTPTAAELTAGTVTLTLTTTGNGNCVAVSDDMVVTFTPGPTAAAGADQTVCGNNPDVNLSGSVTIATGGTWSGGFGTFSPDANSLFATYTPSLGEIAAGTVTLTLTTTGNGNCLPVTDDITITITPAPTVEAGTGASFCANNPDITLGGAITVATGATWSGGNGTFTPDANTLNAVYTPSVGELTAGTVTLTLTTTGNGDCVAVSDDVTYTFTPAPTIDGGADQVLCENNPDASLTATLTGAGGVTWTGGAGTYSPSANALNMTYTPTAAELTAGTVTLTVTTTGNGNCLPESDDVVITYTPSPTATAGADQTVCANSPDVNLTGSVTIATGGTWSGGFGTFSPNANSLFATYTPSLGEIAAGTVTLTLTTTGNGNCNAVTDQITITITPDPTVDAGTGADFCANNADITLNGSVTIATGGTWSGGSGTFTPDANTLNAVYAPSASEISAGAVTLTLTSTGNGLCAAVTDDVTYTFSPAPTVDAGTDITLCSNNPDASLSGAITVASGAVWSGGAGTFSPNANTLNATYTPTAAEIAGGSLTLTLTTTGNGDCLAESDDVELIFTPSPTANAGADVDVCANDPNVNLNGQVTVVTSGIWTGGNGVFNPNNTTLGAVYTPSPAEIAAGSVTLTLTTTGNGNCLAVTDEMTITIAPAPIVDAGTGFEVCENNPDITLGGSVANATGGTWSGGSGTFTPDANTLNAVYTPSASEIANGSITLTLTSTGNGLCIAETDDVTFTFGPAPTADAGLDQTLCANNADVSLNGAVTIASGGTWSGGLGTFAPNANALNAVYTPDATEIAAGIVTLTLTTTGNGDCLPTQDDVTITFTPAPTASAGSDQTVCENNALVSLNGSVSIASGGTWSGGAGTFTPDANALNPTYLPTAAEIAAGTVTLTLTTTGNGNCNPVSDDMTITITPAPVVDAGIGTEFCSNNADITLAGSVVGGSGGTWSGGSGTFTPDANTLNAIYTPSAGEIALGSITLTLTSTGNGLCMPVSDDVTYTFGPAPTADAGTDQTLCANNADISLNGAVTVATGGTWSGGLGTFSPNANALNAVYTPDATEIAAGTVTLTLTTTGNGDCNEESDDVTITFTPAPTASTGSDQTVCENNALVALNGSVTIATGGTWSGGNGIFTPDANALNPTYLPSAAEIAAGTVTLTLTTSGNGNCSPVSDDLTIIITPAPTVDAGVGFELCANNPDITLGGSVIGATGGTWSGGSGTFTPDANTLNAVYTPSAGEIASGSITLTLTTAGNGTCLAVSDDVTYTFGPATTADAGADQVLCSNNADISLSGTVTIATGGTWSGGLGTFSPNANSLNAIYTPDATEIAAGTVTLTLTTTGNGDCAASSDDITITFTPSPTASAGSDVTVCENNALVALNASVTIATGGTWSGGTGTFTPDNTVLNPTYLPSAAEIAAGTVTLALTTTGNGTCSPVSDDLTISIIDAAVVDAGVGIEYCSNNADIALAGTIIGATGGTWSGGSGTFTPDANDLNAVYTPSASEIANGSVTLTLTSEGNGSCLAVSDDVTYTFGPAPTADAGVDQTLCENNADVTLAGAVTVATGGTWSGGAGTFTPNANVLNAIYTPDQTELDAGFVTLTLTTTGNGDCIAESDDVTITFTPAPTAAAGVDQTVCANSADVTLNGAVSIATGGTWSGGAGTFAPDANTLNAIYTPSAAEIAAGTVTLTLTTTGNGDCIAETDDMTITITPAPVVDAGTGSDFCANNADITLGGSVTGATGGTWSGGSGTFTPDANTLNAIYTPSAGEIALGSITLTLTSTGNGLCIAETDDVTYTFSPAPTADAGIDQTLCANNADVTLTGAVTVATGGTWSGGAGTFVPDANSLNAIYTPDQTELDAGFVTLTLTTTGNGTCNPESDEITITFTPAPTASAGADQTVCENNADVNLNGAVSIATGGTWSGGGGTFSPDANTLNATYSPSLAEIAAGTVTLTLTTTGNGLCNPETDDMTITITPAPIVDAGVGIEYCSNNADITLGGAVVGATGGTWSGGSGTFTPDANTLNAIYTPSAGEIALGSITLTLTSTGNGNCLAVSDDVTYTFGPAPTADAGTDQTLCANNADVSLTGTVTVATGGTWSGGAGTFAPNANTLNAVYTPDQTELDAGFVTLTLTTTGNGDCNAESDEITITFTPAPTASAGIDQTVCENNADVTLNGAVSIATGGTWTGGAGTFAPDANTLNAIYTPSAGEIAAGTVTLTLTTTGNGLCNPMTDEMTITITPAPIVDAGVGFELCSNNADISLAGTVTGATGGTWTGGSGTFTPDANDLNAVYTPSAGEIASGSLTLTLTSTGNGNCIAVSDDVTYTFGPAPTVDAGADQVFCANNADVTLEGQVTIATGGSWSGGLGTFSPNANTLNAVYTPDQTEIDAGTVTLTLLTTGNGSCLPEFDEVTITFTPAPTANAGMDQTVCANNAEVTLNAGVTVATGGTWSGGTGTFVPDANALNAVYTPSAAEIAAGTVTLTLTTTDNGLCNAVTDDMTITITPAPIVGAGADMDVCSNNATFQLNGTAQNATGVQWSGGLGTFDPSNTDLTPMYTPTLPEIVAGSVTLSITTTNDAGCIDVTDQVVITFTPSPTVDAGPDQTLCAATPVATLAGSFTVSGGVQWSGGNGTFFPNVLDPNAVYTPSADELAAGSVTLTLTTISNGTCLAESDDITLFYDPTPTISAGADIIACENNATVTLDGSFTNATGVEWSGGQGFFDPSDQDPNAQYTPSNVEIANGFATLTLTTMGTGACPAVSDEMTITINPAPIVDAGLDFEVCSNNSDIDLNGSVQFAGGGLWSGGLGTFVPNNTALNATYLPTAGEIAAGFVTLTLTSQSNGTCLAESDDITITFTPSPVADAGVDISACENNTTVQLNGSFTVADGANWSGGAGSFNPDNTTMNAFYTPSESELDAGSVTLTLTTFGNGDCFPSTDQMTISFTPAPEVEAGDDFFACVDDLVAPLSGTVTGPTSTGIWTTSGTGTFVPNASDLNADYLISSADSLIGEVTLTLTSADNGNCNAVMDQMTVFILPAGTADAGEDQTLCTNDPVATLTGVIGGAATSGTWTSTGTGTFDPNADETDVTYTPSDADLLAGSVTLTFAVNSCNFASDDVVITYTPSPVVDAGADITACSDEAGAQLGGLVSGASTTGVWTTTNGTGTFLPSPNDLNAVYQWSADDIDAQVIEIVLAATDIGNCLAVSDTLILNVFPEGTADAGPDVDACANNPEVQLTGVLTGADIALWTTSGTGVFAPSDDALSTTYVPSDDDIASGSVDITLNGVNSCNAANDVMTITFLPAPIVDAGPDQEACGVIAPFEINGSITFAGGGVWSTLGSGTFQNVNDLNTFYVASQADIDQGGVELVLTSTDMGDCFAVTDTLFISLSNGILVDAGEDQEVCIDAGQVQLFGLVQNGSTTGVWSTDGNGSFLPSDSDLNAVYQFTQDDIDAGNVTITLTSTNNGICPQADDSFELTFGDAAFVFAGDDIFVCETTTEVPLSGVISGETNTGIWSTDGDGVFVPNNTSLTATYEPGPNDYIAGAVQLTLTSTGSVLCSEGSSSLTLNLLGLPQVDAGPDAVVCADIEPVQLFGSVSGAGGGFWVSSGTGTFVPDNTDITATYLPSEADSLLGSITLTLTSTDNGDCVADSDEMVISFSDAVIAIAGPDQDVCEDIGAVALAGSVEGSTSFNWTTNGTGTFDPDDTDLNANYVPSQADIDGGSIQIYLNANGNANCPAEVDSLTLNFDLLPIIDVASTFEACEVDTEVDLTSNVSNADAILWTTQGTGTFVPDAVSANVTYIPSADEISTGVALLNIAATSEGVCGTVDADVIISFSDLAVVQAGADLVACSIDGSVQLDGNVTGDGYGGEWSTTSFGSFDPDEQTLDANYVFGANDILIGTANAILTSTNNGACPAVTDTLQIEINLPPVIGAGDDDFVCETAGSVELLGTAENTASILWTTDGNGVFFPGDDMIDPEYIIGSIDGSNGEVTLTLTGEGLPGCPDASDDVLITINNPLEADFTFTPACVGAQVQFTDQTKVFAGEIESWRWDFGNGEISNQQNPVFIFTETGTASVQLVVNSSIGCSDTTTQLVTVNQGPNASFIPSTNPAPVNFDIDFNDNSSNAISWNWDFGDGFGLSSSQNPTYSYDEEGDYQVTLLVEGETGCLDSAFTTITVSGELALPPRIPNSFSPNDDGNNDVFYIRGGPFLNLEFIVYDAWGAEVFKTTNPVSNVENGWDGTQNGKQSPVGVYVYTVVATTLDGETYDYSGKLNLFR